MDLKDLQRHLDQEVHKLNNWSVTEFEGYSPIEMSQILHFTFGEDSPIILIFI
mgnify:CR=1 FL=1